MIASLLLICVQYLDVLVAAAVSDTSSNSYARKSCMIHWSILQKDCILTHYNLTTKIVTAFRFLYTTFGCRGSTCRVQQVGSLRHSCALSTPGNTASTFLERRIVKV